MRRLVVLASLLLVSAAAMAQERAYQLPTATEVFRLRSACTELAEKILEGSLIGPALSQEQISNYNPGTNRCYVELTVHAANLSEYDKHAFGRFLYDGQTKEMLATGQINHGKKSGMVFDKQHHTTDLENAGWDDASEYIDEMMTDDRK